MAVENILLFLEEWRMIMIKSEKWKTIFKSKSLIYIVIAFAVAPVAINLGLVFTDIIYEKTGNTLTAKGLNNAEWLGFLETVFGYCNFFCWIMRGICFFQHGQKA